MNQKLIITTILVYLSLGCNYFCNAQTCEVSVGSVMKAMNSIQREKRSPVLFKDFKTFKFRGFEPTDPIAPPIKADTFYRIGFDKSNEIIEINHRTTSDSSDYKLLVYDFASFKLLVVQLNGGRDEGFKYNFSVIVLDKRLPKFFMYVLNFYPSDEGNFGLIDTPVFLKYKMDKIGAIMVLSEHLLPWQLVKISRTQILRTSHFFYEDGNHLSYESVEMHYNTIDKPAPSITSSSCLNSICDEAWKHDGEIFNLNPLQDRSDRLWRLGGMHDFQYKNSRIVSKLPE